MVRTCQSCVGKYLPTLVPLLNKQVCQPYAGKVPALDLFPAPDYFSSTAHTPRLTPRASQNIFPPAGFDTPPDLQPLCSLRSAHKAPNPHNPAHKQRNLRCLPDLCYPHDFPSYPYQNYQQRLLDYLQYPSALRSYFSLPREPPYCADKYDSSTRARVL